MITTAKDDATFLRELADKAQAYWPDPLLLQVDERVRLRTVAESFERADAKLRGLEGPGPWGRCNDCGMQIQEEGSLTHCTRCALLRDVQHENQELRGFVETVRLKARAANDAAQVQIAIGHNGTDDQMVRAFGDLCKSLGTAMAEIEIAAIDANKGTPIVTQVEGEKDTHLGESNA